MVTNIYRIHNEFIFTVLPDFFVKTLKEILKHAEKLVEV